MSGLASSTRKDPRKLATEFIMGKCAPYLVQLDELIRWWKGYKKSGCSNPVLTAKCDRIIMPLEEYRRALGGKVRTMILHLTEELRLHESHGWCRCTTCSNTEALSNNAQRELDRSMKCRGRYIQPLVTRWFLEDDNFSVVDLEIRGPGYDFDILIADGRGEEYDVEVWFGQNKRDHALRESTMLVGGRSGDPHIDRGSVPARLEDVATNLGGISMSSEPDLPKIMEKLGQLRVGHVGFLIACRRQAGQTEILTTDFPIVPPDDIPTNKCIIVLDFDGEMVFGKRGTGYLIHHPSFNPSYREVAQQIVQSLGFKYDQARYTQKKNFMENVDWK